MTIGVEVVNCARITQPGIPDAMEAFMVQPLTAARGRSRPEGRARVPPVRARVAAMITVINIVAGLSPGFQPGM